MRFLVTGITGTLGGVLVKKLLEYFPECEILGISRDEQKQRSLPKDPRLTLRLCDVRDYKSLKRTCKKEFDVCFHLAALKCVDTLEENPEESFLTNIQGTLNLLDLFDDKKTKLVFTSTDKAVYPINSYGVHKAAAEKLVLHRNENHCVVRYGNVVGSRGSFIPNLINTLQNDGKAFITDINMTRFWTTADEAADFVLQCALNGNGLRVLPGLRSSTVLSLIAAVADLVKAEDYTIEEIGIRPGEKIHEHLMTRFETSLGRDITSGDDDSLMGIDELKEFLRGVGVGSL